MPLLDRTGWKPDGFSRELGGAAVIVPLESLDALAVTRAPGQRIGIDIANTVVPHSLRAVQDTVDLIAVAFPKFSDGRGFSLGRMLREQRFAGVLRASGSIIPDQFAFALQCGFDEVEIGDEQAARQPIEQWLRALEQIGSSYQPAANCASIFERRAAARG